MKEDRIKNEANGLNTDEQASSSKTDRMKKSRQSSMNSTETSDAETKSVITLAGNLAIGGGNFIVINTTDTDAQENIEQILTGIKRVSPEAVARIIDALADRISNS